MARDKTNPMNSKHGCAANLICTLILSSMELGSYRDTHKLINLFNILFKFSKSIINWNKFNSFRSVLWLIYVFITNIYCYIMKFAPISTNINFPCKFTTLFYKLTLCVYVLYSSLQIHAMLYKMYVQYNHKHIYKVISL